MARRYQTISIMVNAAILARLAVPTLWAFPPIVSSAIARNKAQEAGIEWQWQRVSCAPPPFCEDGFVNPDHTHLEIHLAIANTSAQASRAVQVRNLRIIDDYGYPIAPEAPEDYRVPETTMLAAGTTTQIVVYFRTPPVMQKAILIFPRLNHNDEQRVLLPPIDCPVGDVMRY